jgi:protein ImuB
MAVLKDCSPFYYRQNDLSGTDAHRGRSPVSSKRTKLLWLCLHFAELPLEIFSRADNAHVPLAISSGAGSRARVLLCNHPALAHGIRPHMKISAAYALSAGLIVQPRNEAAERTALEHIAAWATQYTPMVSLVPPCAMVLEIGGSLALFAGLENLLTRLKASLKALGYEACLGIAPTPLGATWLARAGAGEPVTDSRKLRTRLQPLPIQVLNLPSEVFAKLAGLGLHCIGDCLRMPRDGLARRFGPQFLLVFDQALGKVADARQAFVPPSRFVSQLLLPAPVSNCEALLFGIHHLLLELAGFLQARAAGIQQLHLQLLHSKGTPTPVTLRLVAASCDAGYLRELLQVQLEDLQLSQPVEGVRLWADHIQSLPTQHQGLFSDHDLSAADKTKVEPAHTAEWLARQPLTPAHQYQLVERLRARLGEDAVRGLCLVPEHRPERTYRWCEAGEVGARNFRSARRLSTSKAGARLGFGARPLWLLVDPLPLKVMHGHPWLQGKLRLQSGPERIESGWWDGQDITRDYFVAHNPTGSRFWIFRERGSGYRWFLHGIFA